MNYAIERFRPSLEVGEYRLIPPNEVCLCSILRLGPSGNSQLLQLSMNAVYASELKSCFQSDIANLCMSPGYHGSDSESEILGNILFSNDSTANLYFMLE